MKLTMKKALGLLMCLVLMMGLVACGEKPAEQPANTGTGTYKAGTYTAVAKGNNGDVKVEVVFNDTSITSVKVLEHVETAGLSDTPIQRIPEKIVSDQTLAVDAVAGATNTSNAILTAVEDCVKQAGGDVEALKVAKASTGGEAKVTEMTTDVLVIGGGGTGLSAAASAHEHGADVILLEKLATVGGSTALSGGSISAPGSRFQKEKGIEDTKEAWMNLWKERQATTGEGKYPDYTKVDKFIDAAIVTTEWLVDYVGHTYADIVGFGFDPVARLHNPEKNGADITNNIQKFIEPKGVQILTETSATELITNDKGEVVGVKAKGVEGDIIINAKKVILASGGFAKNDELLAKWIPEFAGSAGFSAASAGSTGDGIVMAEKLGAALYEEPWVIGLGAASKVSEIRGIEWDPSKILVNGKGERFFNEGVHYAIVTNEVVKQDQTWVLIDSAESNARYTAALSALTGNAEVATGATIEELAKAMGVDATALTNTVKTYNEGAKAGKDAFGKAATLLAPVEVGPYYAVKYYAKTMGTFGGVKTNDDFQVLKADGTVIPNLYAGGECANRVYYNQVYMTGSAVQLALTSGRIAGEHAAKNIK